MKLLDTEYKEIEAYMKRRADIKEVAFKIFKEVRLTEVEIEAAKNYYDNLKNINSIKGLDKITRADIEVLLNIFEDYFSSQEEKIEKLEDSKTVEQLPVKKLVDINTVAISPLRYYAAQALPKIRIIALAYVMLILFEKFVGTGVIDNATPSMESFILIYQSAVGALIKIFLTISLLLTSMNTLFDIMYITMPMVREPLKQAKLVSNIADIAVLQGE